MLGCISGQPLLGLGGDPVLTLVLIEDERGGSPVELDGAADSISALASSWHDDRWKIERVEDGRMSGKCAVKRWGLLADFTIP